MRDLGLLLGFLVMLVPALRYPHVGVLLWCWTAMVVPNFYVYGFAYAIPFNRVAAIVTLLVWLVSRESKKIPLRSTMILLGFFGIWGTISALTGIGDFSIAMVELEKFAKIIVFSFVVVGLITTKGRVDALLYSIYLSLGFHGVAEGAKFLTTGGGHQVYGPGSSILGDNNNFALAMVSVLPIVLYLYKQSNHLILKLALVGSSFLVIAAIMGTYSRGGLIGVLAVGVYALMRTDKKFKYILWALPLIAAAVVYAPSRWSNRMDTISTANDDASFMSRVTTWKQCAIIAMDYPIFGSGFYAVQNRAVWGKYAGELNRLNFVPAPPPDPLIPRAAHSIYFQVLVDMGFIGLAIFVAILVSAWRNAAAIVRNARGRPEWLWAANLATSLKYSLIAYIVSGASLSMAYFEYMYMIFALLVAVRKMVGEPLARGHQSGSSVFAGQSLHPRSASALGPSRR